MPCNIVPGINDYEWVQEMLCQAMKLLSVEQIKSFHPIDCYYKAAEWYYHHLQEDYLKNKDKEKEIAEKELERLGFIIEEDDEAIYFRDTKGISPWGGTKVMKRKQNNE